MLVIERTLQIFDKHKGKFGNRGLRWNIPKKCYYLELWLNYQMNINHAAVSRKEKQQSKIKPKLNIEFLEDGGA